MIFLAEVSNAIVFLAEVSNAIVFLAEVSRRGLSELCFPN
jgi:hypothetical protein